MTLLIWGFIVVERKTRKSGEKSWRVVSHRGSLRRAKRSAQPHFNQQRHLKKNRKKSQHKIRKRSTIKEGIKTLHVSPGSNFEPGDRCVASNHQSPESMVGLTRWNLGRLMGPWVVSPCFRLLASDRGSSHHERCSKYCICKCSTRIQYPSTTVHINRRVRSH
jgi:hypothetical protein